MTAAWLQNELDALASTLDRVQARLAVLEPQLPAGRTRDVVELSKLDAMRGAARLWLERGVLADTEVV